LQGTRVAQMIIQPYLKVTPVESPVNKQTERGEKGFGSSNVSKYWKLQNNVNIFYYDQSINIRILSFIF
jgi:hypothetical protein